LAFDVAIVGGRTADSHDTGTGRSRDNRGLISQLSRRAAAIGEDNRSGASALSRQARALLAEALHAGCASEIAAALVRAQPSMASIWNAAISAVESATVPEVWSRNVLRWDRADGVLERMAIGALTSDGPPPRRVVTFSMSGSVMRVLTRLAEVSPLGLRVSCSEGRPALEGQRLAATLPPSGIAVDFYTDAALGGALGDADLLLLGADAIGGTAWVNKAGTQMLAAAAYVRGLAVHIVTTADTLVMPSLWPHLVLRHGPPGEVWDTAPAGVRLHNPYFESIPLDFVTTVITDIGVLGADMVPSACAARETPNARRALAELLKAFDV
jgi:translation initiation factor 2B subunit (eIF-2B alpha/beta/delta family)